MKFFNSYIYIILLLVYNKSMTKNVLHKFTFKRMIYEKNKSQVDVLQ